MFKVVMTRKPIQKLGAYTLSIGLLELYGKPCELTGH